MNKAELQQWKANSITEEFFSDIEKAIQEAREAPRMYATTDTMIILNARLDGMLEAYQELEQWYEGKLEEFSNED